MQTFSSQIDDSRYGLTAEELSRPPGLIHAKVTRISDPFIVHDIITAINGSPIKNSSDFYNYIHNKSVGDKVVLTTMHDGVTRNFAATLGEIPS